MNNKAGRNDLIVVTSNSGMTRWAPIAIVLIVVGGFMMLSWYAYHAGIQSVKEEDLVVVEADKTPMKEKPADPGGMQFPNQDKTVFETFSSNNHQPAKVERVLPTPEEPMPKDKDTEASEPTTWVNKDLKKPNAEQVIGNNPIATSVMASDAKPVYETPSTANQASEHQVKEEQAPADEEQSASYVAPKKTQAVVPAAVPNEENQAHPSTSDKEVKAPAAAAKLEPSEGGNTMIQLGAYRSEEEANDNWKKIHLKQKDLSDKTPLIVKADLGNKGIYYRLRVGGLSPADAKALCKALNAKGQACIIPVGKDTH